MDSEEIALLLVHGSDALLKELAGEHSDFRQSLDELTDGLMQIAKVMASASYSMDEFLGGIVQFGTASMFDEE